MPHTPTHTEETIQNQLQSTSTGFALDLPSITSALDFNKATQSPFTTQDTSKLLADLRGQQLRVAELLKPTAREQQLQQQIAGLETGFEATTEALRFRPGLDIPTFGRAVTEEERTTRARLAPLQRQLGIEQQARAGEAAGQQFLAESTQQQLNFARQLEQDAFQRQQSLFQIVNTLRDDARTLFNTATSNLKGLGWEDLDTSTRTQLTNLSRNIGLDVNLVKAGLSAEKQLAQSQKLKTQVVEVGGRKKLIDLTTGATIQDLGVADITNGTKFTNTQINSGAATANIPISEFKKLDDDTKNYFINRSKEMDENFASIDRRIKNGDTRQEIENAVFADLDNAGLAPNVVEGIKSVITNYLETKNVPTEKSPGAFGKVTGAIKSWWNKLF